VIAGAAARARYDAAMPWYASHAVLYVEFKEGPQDDYYVWENVHLIEAADGKEAHEKAYEVARRDEGDSGGSFTFGGRPARWVLAGIRKLITVSHMSGTRELASGDEVTFSAMRVADLDTVRKLAAGDEVTVVYEE
jgi:hypothetical protein